jgi:membrane-associated phospholipid phosphatase
MILAIAGQLMIRTAIAVMLVVATACTCLSQQLEMQKVFIDDELQQFEVSQNVEPSLNLDILNRQPALSWHSMFTQLPSNWARSAGISLKSESVPALAGLGVLTFSFLRTDHESYRATRRWYRNSEDFSEFSNYAVALGDGRLHLGIAAAFAGYGWMMDDSKSLRVASQTVEAFLATGITVQVLKRISGRESPIEATRNAGRWKFCPNPSLYQKHQASYYAYPSGHISTAMATLTVIAENYPQEQWIKPVGYTLVGALGVGLVAKGMHWYSDLPVGIALGYLFGKVAANPALPDFVKPSGEKGVEFSVVPTIDGQGGGGIHFAMAF